MLKSLLTKSWVRSYGELDELIPQTQDQKLKLKTYLKQDVLFKTFITDIIHIVRSIISDLSKDVLFSSGISKHGMESKILPIPMEFIFLETPIEVFVILLKFLEEMLYFESDSMELADLLKLTLHTSESISAIQTEFNKLDFNFIVDELRDQLHGKLIESELMSFEQDKLLTKFDELTQQYLQILNPLRHRILESCSMNVLEEVKFIYYCEQNKITGFTPVYTPERRMRSQSCVNSATPIIENPLKCRKHSF